MCKKIKLKGAKMLVYIVVDKQFKKLANDFNCEEDGVYANDVNPEDYDVWDYDSDEDAIKKLKEKGVNVEIFESDSEWLSSICCKRIELY